MFLRKNGKRNVSAKEIGRVAGLLEGEGSFSIRTTPCIRLKMTDRDVVSRVATLFGVEVQPQARDVTHPHWKRQYLAQLYSGNAAGWMMTIYPLMGQRRRAKIRAILAQWRAMPGKPYSWEGRFGVPQKEWDK